MVNSIMSITLICIVFCIVQYSVSLREANEASIQVEDGLAASCLAGLSIDLQKFTDTYVTGKTDVIVKDAMQSYCLFKDTLKTNLNTSTNMLIQNVSVKQYIVYNIFWNRTDTGVNEKNIDIYFFDNNGIVKEVHKPYEDVYSPNGIKVTQTSVYADIGFDLTVYAGRKINCHRQLLTQAYKK